MRGEKRHAARPGHVGAGLVVARAFITVEAVLCARIDEHAADQFAASVSSVGTSPGHDHIGFGIGNFRASPLPDPDARLAWVIASRMDNRCGERCLPATNTLIRS